MNALEGLALSHVLVTELPVTLGTVRAPARYDVAAVFTRRPTTSELRLLTDPAVKAKLVERDYPTVSLRAADRWLVIGSTSLTELNNGLGPLIGKTLSDISAEAVEEQGHRDPEAASHLREETVRASTVVRAAEQVDCRPHASLRCTTEEAMNMPKHRKTSEEARADQRWETDGGSTGAEPPPPIDAAAVLERDRRWQDENDQHWHNAGYSDDTRCRQDGG